MGRRTSAIALVAILAAGSLAIWTVIPFAWLWLTRNFDSETTRYLLTVPGCAITMLVAGALLYRLEAVYLSLSGTGGRGPPRSAWLKSVGEARRPSRQLTLLDVFLMISAVVAFIALVCWWAFFADSPDPSGPLQPL